MDHKPANRATELTSPEDILAKMRAGIKETYEIRMREMVIPVRVLSIDEVNNIRREALTNALIAKGDETDKNVHIQKITLKLASTIGKGSGPILGDRLLSMLTVDEINYLYEEYIAVMDRVNPSLESIPPEQFGMLVDALKKNLVFARDLSLRQLRAICSAFQDMIQRPDSQTSPKGN